MEYSTDIPLHLNPVRVKGWYNYAEYHICRMNLNTPI